MARYAFSYEVDGVCKLHAESTFDEDAVEDSYDRFQSRCKKMIRDYQRIARAYEDNVLASDKSREDFPVGKKCRAVITDLNSGAEDEI